MAPVLSVLGLVLAVVAAKQPDQDEASFNFGDDGDRGLSGRELAEAYPDDTCTTQHFQCIKNPEHVIASFNATTPYDCCKSCLANTDCGSFSFWYADLPGDTQYEIGSEPMCHLFDVDIAHESSNVSAGNCVIGTNGQAQKRPNFVLFYPDTVRYARPDQYLTPQPSPNRLSAPR